MTTILFLHGWQSIPGSVKPTYLKEHGHTVINPALDDNDFETALATAQAEFDRHHPQVIVGSSRGGAIALNIDSGATPLVLICPAWKRWGLAKVLKPNSVILHSRRDDVIPFAESEELVARSHLATETLIEVGNDHRLADNASLGVLLWACDVFAAGQQMPWMEEEFQNSSSLDTQSGESAQKEAQYVCDACGEEIVIPLDQTEGASQTYVEDCPVCCRANTIHVEFDDEGNTQVWAAPEQDHK